MARPIGVIAFMSDFGCSSPYVGQVHAVIDKLSNGKVRVIDLCHEVPSYNIIAGAYLLYASYKYFRPGTVFLAVVDPGVGSRRRAIAIETKHYFLVGPDNGLLWPVAKEDGIVKAVTLTNDTFWLKPTSHTFHGRDIFAPAAVALALGVPIESLGDEINPDKLVQLDIRYMERRDAKSVCVKVVYIDAFGNIAMSVTSEDIDLNNLCVDGRVKVCVKDNCVIAKCAKTFSEVDEKEYALYTNSFGFLELAVFKDSAAKALGVKEGDTICINAF